MNHPFNVKHNSEKNIIFINTFLEISQIKIKHISNKYDYIWTDMNYSAKKSFQYCHYMVWMFNMTVYELMWLVLWTQGVGLAYVRNDKLWEGMRTIFEFDFRFPYHFPYQIDEKIWVLMRKYEKAKLSLIIDISSFWKL